MGSNICILQFDKTHQCVNVPPTPIVVTSSKNNGGGGDPKKPNSPNRPPIWLEGEKAGLYPELFMDVSTLDAIHQATHSITDSACREALHLGISSALDALRRRTAGAVTKIELSE